MGIKTRKISCVCLLYMSFTAMAYQVPHEVTVFQQNVGDYECYRCPAIVCTNGGTLLAIIEGRVDGCSDFGNIDIIAKRSTNGGASWSASILIDSEGTHRLHNPTPVVDKDTGRIYVFYCMDANDIYYKYSDNDGVSWSSHQWISGYPSDVDVANGSILTGPGHAIQLLRGSHQGRLVVPYRYKTSGGARKIRLLYSDDGNTWYQLIWRIFVSRAFESWIAESSFIKTAIIP